MRILVADDSATMRKIIREALESMGYSPENILEAADGMDAIRMLRKPRSEIDIILADWNMPNMDGLALLKELHAAEEFRSIPFIMVTSQAQRDRVLEVIRAGARNYIVKPFTPETLREKVLGIEMELFARRHRNPSETAVIRLEATKVIKREDSDLPFLAQLPEELVASMFASASLSEHEEGHVLIEPADVVRSLNIVDAGEVEILPPEGPEARWSRGEIYGRGECFGELSFLSGDAANLAVRARTEVVIASVGKSDFEALLAEYPHLSFYLMRLLAKRARKADAKLTSELEKGFSGRLSTIGLADLVQTLNNSEKTGLLRLSTTPQAGVQTGGEEGEIYFVDGNIAYARIGGQTGEEAFYQLLAWANGGFTFETGSRQIEQDIFRATRGLLMEAMRRQDELQLAAAGRVAIG